MPRRIGVDKEKQNKRQNEWTKLNCDRINLKVPKGTRDKWRERAVSEGKSLNKWIIDRVSRD